MFKFSFYRSPIYKAVKAPLILRKADFIKKICFYLFIAFLVFLILATVESRFRILSTEVILGIVILFFSLFIAYWYLALFFKLKLKQPDNPISMKEASSRIEEIDFADFLSYESAEILDKVLRSKEKDSTTLLYYLLKDADFSHFVFTRLLIDKAKILGAVNSLRDKRSNGNISDCLKEVIVKGLQIAAKRSHEKIEPEDLFVALASTNDFFEKILIDYDIKVREIEALTSWYLRIRKREEKRRRFWEYEHLSKAGSLGREWASGSTYLLEKFAVDWNNALIKRGFRKTIGHEESINVLERIVSADGKNNAILVGRPGTGRRSVIDEITRRSFLGISTPGINYKRVFKLKLQSLIAIAEGKEDTERILDKLFNEVASAGNIILVIENIHEFVAGKERPGVVDISGIIEPYLNHPDFRLIGITNYMDYRRVIEKNQSINSHLRKVEISEATQEDTVRLCEMITGSLENKYGVFISYQAIKAVVELSERFLSADPFPEKAMDLLEEAVTSASQEGKNVLTKEDVAEILSEKAEVPVGEAAGEEKKVLLNLEEEVHKRIINQEKAVSQISRSLRRSRTDIDTRTGLIGSFLFLGPTGVGKTETAKAISDIYFGSVKKMIRIDMSEYQNISDISRLIGSEEVGGILTEQVIEDPFSLILLDELEKAHKNILNLFLQILDEGHVTDGVGRKIDFKNSMIIATSNAGYQLIMDSVKKGIDPDTIKEKILDHLFKKSIFRPEFVNRFDGTVIFKPLSEENLIDIAELQLQKMRESLKEKHISFRITEELKKKIVDSSYDPVFGAREMQRFIQNEIGDTLATAILSDEINPGDEILINPEDFSFKKIN